MGVVAGWAGVCGGVAGRAGGGVGRARRGGARGTGRRPLPAHARHPQHPAFSLSQSGDHTVKVVDTATGATLAVLRGHRRTPWVVRFHPTRPGVLASGSLDHEARMGKGWWGRGRCHMAHRGQMVGRQAEGGCGGNSATPERWKPRRLPESLRAETRRKILFSLKEKEIHRAQNKKSNEYFSAGHACGASGGGANQPFRSKKVRAKCKISPLSE